MIVKNINEYDFIRAFEEMNRKNQFSEEGLKALYEYLYDLSEDAGENITLDVIALCCEYTEYRNIDEYLNDYYTTDEINKKVKDLSEEEFKETIEEEIEEKTTLIKLSDDLDKGFIIRVY